VWGKMGRWGDWETGGYKKIWDVVLITSQTSR
jgi:hypothetical protein